MPSSMAGNYGVGGQVGRMGQVGRVWVWEGYDCGAGGARVESEDAGVAGLWCENRDMQGRNNVVMGGSMGSEQCVGG